MESIVFLDRGTVKTSLRSPGFPHRWVDFDRTRPEETVDRLKGASIAVTNKVVIREPELRQLPSLRFIAVTATGYNIIDVEACRRRGVTVSNVPGYARESVAEHVLMMALALRRRLPVYAAAVGRGDWQRSPHFALLDYPVADLRGAALGLIGYGDIAREVERLARAFGMEVLVAERPSAGSTRPGRTAFERVLEASDVISLHCPLTEETRGLIGREALARMKPGAILINTARGGIVDEAALAEALRSGRLGGAGVDVLTAEPPPEGHPLLAAGLANLIVTPHVAWASDAALGRLAEAVIGNVEAFVAGRPQNVVS